MERTSIEYGPFTPQEADRISAWLKNNQIPFVIAKDEQSEKLAMMNDGINIVNRVEFRTDTYLGQIFYFQITFSDDQQKLSFDQLFGLKVETERPGASQAMVSDFEDQQHLVHDQLRHHRKKQAWAIFLSAWMIGMIVISFIYLFKK
ncbi:MAG: hypothetical protein A2622_03480 [Bdellovibrionales bacterium RIFCSPHIGHO2_01_FULL_40_29]|nr:MAG: hypothetical protein A2622_03480 [Bdellovibrionales bacterium RIFCSPHIGHO2_01_FULL_40_29]OFZ35416.1 MAG: hypothetical protein A3D17_08550 [Bdellovibrionales bacterium RIFCSPHIGHO2_02_FULL_40_15]